MNLKKILAAMAACAVAVSMVAVSVFAGTNSDCQCDDCTKDDGSCTCSSSTCTDGDCGCGADCTTTEAPASSQTEESSGSQTEDPAGGSEPAGSDDEPEVPTTTTTRDEFDGNVPGVSGFGGDYADNGGSDDTPATTADTNAPEATQAPDVSNTDDNTTDNTTTQAPSNNDNNGGNDDVTPSTPAATVQDTATGVKVSGAVPAGATLVVEAPVINADKTKATFEITLENAGVAVQPDGTVTVTIPVPADLAGADTYYVYYQADDGSLTDMKATLVNGEITFSTTHFSTYIVSTVALATNENNPSTALAIVFIPAAAAAAGVIVAKKRK